MNNSQPYNVMAPQPYVEKSKTGFPVRLTDVITDTAGRHHYDWVEQTVDSFSAAFVDAVMARRGSADGQVIVPAFEINNQLIDLSGDPVYAILRLRGFNGGLPIYDFSVGGGSGGGDSIWIKISSSAISGGWYEGEAGDFSAGFWVDTPSTSTDPILVRPSTNTPLAAGYAYRCWPDAAQDETGPRKYIAEVPPSIVRTMLSNIVCNPGGTGGPTITKTFRDVRVLLPEP